MGNGKATRGATLGTLAGGSRAGAPLAAGDRPVRRSRGMRGHLTALYSSIGRPFDRSETTVSRTDGGGSFLGTKREGARVFAHWFALHREGVCCGFSLQAWRRGFPSRFFPLFLGPLASRPIPWRRGRKPARRATAAMVGLVANRDELRLRRGGALGPQVFGEAFLRKTDDAVGSSEDRLRRPIVAVECNDARRQRELVRKVEDVAYGRGAERVDRLGVIADHCQAPAAGLERQQARTAGGSCPDTR
jgi:hypothetical protein